MGVAKQKNFGAHAILKPSLAKNVVYTHVFGGVERGSNDVFMVEVRDRSAATLLPIIQRFIKPGTTVISDEWRAYRQISSLGMAHQTVNHSLNFVDPVSGSGTFGKVHF